MTLLLLRLELSSCITAISFHTSAHLDPGAAAAAAAIAGATVKLLSLVI